MDNGLTKQKSSFISVLDIYFICKKEIFHFHEVVF